MYAIWTKEKKNKLVEVTRKCLDNECRAISSLLLHEGDAEERADLESRFIQVNELRAQASDGFKVYLDEGNILLEPKDGGAMELKFVSWLCDDLIPS